MGKTPNSAAINIPKFGWQHLDLGLATDLLHANQISLFFTHSTWEEKKAYFDGQKQLLINLAQAFAPLSQVEKVATDKESPDAAGNGIQIHWHVLQEKQSFFGAKKLYWVEVQNAEKAWDAVENEGRPPYILAAIMVHICASM